MATCEYGFNVYGGRAPKFATSVPNLQCSISFSAVVKVARSSREAQGTEASRGLKREQGAEPP